MIYMNNSRAKVLLDAVDDMMISIIEHGINKDDKFKSAVDMVSKARNLFFKESLKNGEPLMPIKPEPVVEPRKLHMMEKMLFLDEVVDKLNGEVPRG